jgi:hypothetical protein
LNDADSDFTEKGEGRGIMGGFRKKNQLKNINSIWDKLTNEHALNMSKFPYQCFILPYSKMLLAREGIWCIELK